MIDSIVPLSDDISSDYSKSREKFLSGELRSYKAEVLIITLAVRKNGFRTAHFHSFDEVTGKVIGAFGILLNITENKQNLNRYEEGNTESGGVMTG